MSLLLALLLPAHAVEIDSGDWGSTRINGDLKMFMVGVFPNEDTGFDPSAQGILSARAKLAGEIGPTWWEIHHVVNALSDGGAFSFNQTGVTATAPEAVELGWTGVDEGMSLFGRTDRLVVGTGVGPVEIALGRQAISFGNGFAFTPLDLVNPFFPTTVDQEYKPGVDAVRVDGFWGMTGQASLVAAYGGDWDREGMVYAAYAQQGVGRSDIGVMFAEVHGDHVFGATIASYIGAVGLTSDLAVTLPYDEDEDPFFRGTLGGLFRPTGTTTTTAELYVQTLGETDPALYPYVGTSDRYGRGELWLAGRTYASVSVGQEIGALIGLSVAAIANLEDPSVLLVPGISWSVSDEVQVVAGGYLGFGEDAEDPSFDDLGEDRFDLGVRSEFGSVPPVAYVQMKAYF